VYEVEGRPADTYKAGDVLIVLAARSTREEHRPWQQCELATYVVEKGKPVVTLVK